MRPIAIVILVLFAAGSSFGADLVLPRQPTPQFALAKMLPGGDIDVVFTALTTGWDTTTTIENGPDGTARSIPVTSLVYKAQKCGERLRRGRYWVMRQGQRLDAHESQETLDEVTPVVLVLVRDVQAGIDPFYAQFLKSETIIIGARMGRATLRGTISAPGK